MRVWRVVPLLTAGLLGGCGHWGQASHAQRHAARAGEGAARAADMALLSAAEALRRASDGPAALAAANELAWAAQALRRAGAQLRRGAYADAQACAYIAQRRAELAGAQAGLKLARLRAEAAHGRWRQALSAALAAPASAAAPHAVAGQTRAAKLDHALAHLTGASPWRHEPGRGHVLTLAVAELFVADTCCLSAAGGAQARRLAETLQATGVRHLNIDGPTALAPQALALAAALVAAGLAPNAVRARPTAAENAPAPACLDVVVADDAADLAQDIKLFAHIAVAFAIDGQ